MAESYPPKLAETLAYLLQLDDTYGIDSEQKIFYEDDDDLESAKHHREQSEIMAKSKKLQEEVGSKAQQEFLRQQA